jgi:hypothetical protein
MVGVDTGEVLCTEVLGTEEVVPAGGFVMNVLSGVTIALPDESRE